MLTINSNHLKVSFQGALILRMLVLNLKMSFYDCELIQFYFKMPNQPSASLLVDELVIPNLCKIDSKYSVVSGSLSDSILLVLVVFFAQKSDFEQLLLLGRQHFAALFWYLFLNMILSNLHPKMYVTDPFDCPNVFHAKSYYLLVYWIQLNRACSSISAPIHSAVNDCRYSERDWFECRSLVQIQDQKSSI